MHSYVTIKSILMAAALGAAFGLFSTRVRRLYRIMRAVEGKSICAFDRIGDRIRVIVTDVLAQSNVRRKRLPGLAHTLIFFGFLAVQPHSAALMLQGVFPHIEIARLAPQLYGTYLFVADILAFLVLFGLGYALYRRVFIRPKYLTDGLDARLIILFTVVIILSFHCINAFEILRAGSDGGFDYGKYFSVSAAVLQIFHLEALSDPGRTFGYELSYWLHVLTILGFLVYIPGSKHLHLLAAVPNVFLKPLEQSKAMIKTDIEDDDAESFGLGKVTDLSWKNVLDLYACTECGRCEQHCPADATGKPLSPKNVVCDIKHDLLDQAHKVLSKNGASVQPLVREQSPLTADVLWSCTTCRACEEICPVNIQHLDLILEARKYQVLMEAAFPQELQETFISLENQSNPWGFGSDTRADWCKDMDVPLMADKPDAEILYFVGCAGSFNDRGKQISRALARVLHKADVNFAILGPEEGCNGDLARRAGNEYLAQMMIQQNVETLKQYRPQRILSACPHCFNSIKNEYSQFGTTVPVVHHSQFLPELIETGRLKLKKDRFNEIVYHDSCYLGRWNGIYDAPRKLLQAVTEGKSLIELQRSRSSGFCCGAGGARLFMEETIGRRINHVRSEEILATRAKTVAAACPFCITMLRDGIADNAGDAIVQDIAEIIDIATE